MTFFEAGSSSSKLHYVSRCNHKRRPADRPWLINNQLGPLISSLFCNVLFLRKAVTMKLSKLGKLLIIKFFICSSIEPKLSLSIICAYRIRRSLKFKRVFRFFNRAKLDEVIPQTITSITKVAINGNSAPSKVNLHNIFLL